MNDTNKLLLLRPDLLIKHNKSGGFFTIALIYYIYLIIENSLLTIVFLTSIDPQDSIDHPVWLTFWIIIYVISCGISCGIVYTIISRPFDGTAKLRVLSTVYTIIDLVYVVSQYYASNGEFTVTYLTPLINFLFCVYFWLSEKVKYRQLCGKGYCNLLKKDFGKDPLYHPEYNNMIYYFSLELYAAKAYMDYCGNDPIKISLLSDLYNCFYFVLKHTIKLKKDNSIKSIRDIILYTNSKILPRSVDNRSFRDLLKVYNETKNDDDLYIPALVNYIADKYKGTPKVNIDAKMFVVLLSTYEYNLIIGDFCKSYYYVLYLMNIDHSYENMGIQNIFKKHTIAFSEINKPIYDDTVFEGVHEALEELRAEEAEKEQNSAQPYDQITLFDVFPDEQPKAAHKESTPNVQQPKPEIKPQPERLFCTKCGVHLPADAVFCHKCGSKVYKE